MRSSRKLRSRRKFVGKLRSGRKILGKLRSGRNRKKSSGGCDGKKSLVQVYSQLELKYPKIMSYLKNNGLDVGNLVNSSKSCMDAPCTCFASTLNTLYHALNKFEVTETNRLDHRRGYMFYQTQTFEDFRKRYDYPAWLATVTTPVPEILEVTIIGTDFPATKCTVCATHLGKPLQQWKGIQQRKTFPKVIDPKTEEIRLKNGSDTSSRLGWRTCFEYEFVKGLSMDLLVSSIGNEPVTFNLSDNMESDTKRVSMWEIQTQKVEQIFNVVKQMEQAEYCGACGCKRRKTDEQCSECYNQIWKTETSDELQARVDKGKREYEKGIDLVNQSGWPRSKLYAFRMQAEEKFEAWSTFEVKLDELKLPCTAFHSTGECTNEDCFFSHTKASEYEYSRLIRESDNHPKSTEITELRNKLGLTAAHLMSMRVVVAAEAKQTELKQAAWDARIPEQTEHKVSLLRQNDDGIKIAKQKTLTLNKAGKQITVRLSLIDAEVAQQREGGFDNQIPINVNVGSTVVDDKDNIGTVLHVQPDWKMNVPRRPGERSVEKFYVSWGTEGMLNNTLTRLDNINQAILLLRRKEDLNAAEKRASEYLNGRGIQTYPRKVLNSSESEVKTPVTVVKKILEFVTGVEEVPTEAGRPPPPEEGEARAALEALRAPTDTQSSSGAGKRWRTAFTARRRRRTARRRRVLRSR